MHFSGTCVYKSAERLQNPIFPAGETRFFRKSLVMSCLGAHDVRTVMQRSCGLCGDSRNSLKRFVEGDGKCKSGSCNDEISYNVIFQLDITRCFCYVVAAISTWRIFGNTAGFDRVCSISFICTVAKLT